LPLKSELCFMLCTPLSLLRFLLMLPQETTYLNHM